MSNVPILGPSGLPLSQPEQPAPPVFPRFSITVLGAGPMPMKVNVDVPTMPFMGDILELPSVEGAWLVVQRRLSVHGWTIIVADPDAVEEHERVIGQG